MAVTQTLEVTAIAQDRAHSRADALRVAPWPFFAEDEIEAAVRVLRSGKVNYWTGQEGRLFEAEFAAFVGCKHAIDSGQWNRGAGVRVEGVGRGAGDEVVTTSRTFIASASCAVMLGAHPVIADVGIAIAKPLQRTPFARY